MEVYASYEALRQSGVSTHIPFRRDVGGWPIPVIILWARWDRTDEKVQEVVFQAIRHRLSLQHCLVGDRQNAQLLSEAGASAVAEARTC